MSTHLIDFKYMKENKQNLVEIINKILFEYNDLTYDMIVELCGMLDKKTIRYLGANHPDNKTRKIFFELTNVSIGEGSVINRNFVVSDNYKPLLRIGERVAIGPNVTIVCASGPNNSLLASNSYVAKKLIVEKEVVIEDDAWIGANVVILPGVIIGSGSIIGAGSVVVNSTKPFTIYAGIPAKKIREM